MVAASLIRDELQAIKAGILELADLLVVTKCDTDGARRACQALQTVAPLWRNAPPIHPVSALSGEGIAELAEAVLRRARSAPPLARQTAVSPAAPAQTALAACFDRLRADVDRRLPFDWAGSLALQLQYGACGEEDARLGVVCTLRSGGEAFQLGAAAAGLILLAAEMHLDCAVEEMDAAGGKMHLVFRHAA